MVGSNDKKDQWLDWKYFQATTSDGKTTIGLGTNVGGMAMCYRSDLFAKAGLPTDRAAVSKLWATWDDYITTGKTFKSKVTDAGFIDAGTNTFNLILMQMAGNANGYTYYDKSNNLVIDSNPVVKQAWDKTIAGHRRRPLGQPAVLDRRLDRRFQERQVRHHRLPGLDDRCHQGQRW